MAKVVINLSDEVVANLSDEARELLFEAARYAASELYASETGTSIEDWEFDVEDVKYNIEITGFIDDGKENDNEIIPIKGTIASEIEDFLFDDEEDEGEGEN